MTREEAIERLKRVKTLEVFGTSYMPALDLAIAALERDRWISVEDRLPEKTELVLVKSKLVKMKTDFICKDGNWYTTPAVTHWMPLPEPPKEET